MSSHGVKIISASAGSGKTTRLARVLVEGVASGEVRPEAVIATTFTHKAAAELQERTRRCLLQAGKIEQAHRLAASRIGTVNAICDGLLADFAFELGLSPRPRVIDEHLSAQLLGRAMATAVPAEIERELNLLGQRFEQLGWRGAAQRIIEACRANAVEIERLKDFAKRSARSALALLASPTKQRSAALRAQLASALDGFIADVDLDADTTKKTRRAVGVARHALSVLNRDSHLSWKQWADLATLDVAVASRPKVEALRQAAGLHDRHPDLHRHLRRAIEGVFEVAARTLDAYQTLKRDWGVVDFVDQESLALALLRRPSVQARLSGSIDLVLVDEFQDTSPLQLAIFIELAKIAKRSIWVGDQKQAIYSFRGTDPALMNAALQEFLVETHSEPVEGIVEPPAIEDAAETLAISYRSRPELVRLTSDVFAPAFASQGIEEARTRLEPCSEDEPEGLGPIVEHWALAIDDNRRKRDLALAVAAGVVDMLDPARRQRVRDLQGGGARDVNPADLAVLCRTNSQCEAVAAALSDLGVAVIVPRVGLLSTVEGRLTLSALRWWIDPQDRLATAELARVLVFADDDKRWLAEVFAATETSAFSSIPAIERLRASRTGAEGAGPLAALDRIFDAIELRDFCRGLEGTALRLCNLDALRAHAASYVGECATSGLPATPAGLLSYYQALADERDGHPPADHQGLLENEAAVTVSTWHGAKGLEWPIVVLFGLERSRERDTIGVSALSGREDFDVHDPLGDRWIRYLPTPYGSKRRNLSFFDRLRRDEVDCALRAEGRRELLRLLYVGWTRARDRVVLAARSDKLFDGLLGVLRDIDAELIVPPRRQEAVLWGGRPVMVEIRDQRPVATPPGAEPETSQTYRPRPAKAYPPATLNPSRLPPITAAVAAPLVIGPRWPIAPGVDIRALGEAIHAFLAADRRGDPQAERQAMAATLLGAHRVREALGLDGFLSISDALDAFVETRWPGALRAVEWPLAQRLPSGSIVRGAPDLVVETDKVLVLIDHKAFPGDLEAAKARAVGYAAQLQAYARALEAATGKEVVERLIHFPLGGLMIPLVGALDGKRR